MTEQRTREYFTPHPPFLFTSAKNGYCPPSIFWTVEEKFEGKNVVIGYVWTETPDGEPIIKRRIPPTAETLATPDVSHAPEEVWLNEKQYRRFRKALGRQIRKNRESEFAKVATKYLNSRHLSRYVFKHM